MSRFTPEEIAAGLGNPGIAELVSLIHRVNPTDRGLSAAQQAERYALKARLQSRLVRDWGSHLELRLEQTDPGSEPIVSIEHRGHRRDAAHVPLSALDADVRSLVLAALHLPDPSASVPSPASAPKERDDALSRGRAALKDWDYETARHCFEEAFAESPGEAAAHALLELLVEHLALDEDALQLSLPEPVRSARVSRLVALAAARSGDPRQATALLRRLEPMAEAEVRVLLAERALRDEAISEARSQLDALRELDPANGALATIAEGLQVLDGRARAPLEAELAQAIASGEAPAIRAAAEALLQSAPGHAGARAALHAFDQQQRASEASKLSSSAEAHAAAGRWELAIADLQKAGEKGADVRQRLEQARFELTSARTRQAVELALRALSQGDLSRYLDLAPEGRAAVREACPEPRLARLEALLAERVRDPVAALTALEQAEVLLSEEGPEQALSLLRSAALHEVSAARPLVRALQEALAHRNRVQADELLARLARALQSGDLATAESASAALRAEHLPEPDRIRAIALLEEARGRIEEAKKADTFEGLLRDGAAFEARDLAERQLARHPDSSPWQHRRARAEARLLSKHPSKVVQPWAETLHDVLPPQAQFSADACLEPDGRHAWLAESLWRFTFLRRIEVSTSRVVSCTMFRTLTALMRPRVAVFGSVVCLVDRGGWTLVVELDETGRCERIVTWETVPADLKPDMVDPGRDPALRWVVRDDAKALPRHLLWRLPKHRLDELRTPGGVHPLHLPGVGHPLVKLGKTGEIQLLDVETGQHEYLGLALQLLGVAARPRGEGFVCLGRFPPAPGERPALAIFQPGLQGPSHRTELRQEEPAIHPMACSRAQGLLYLLVDSELTGAMELLAFDENLRRVWSYEHPDLEQLLTDAEDQHAVAVYRSQHGVRLCPLGGEPPPPFRAEVENQNILEVIAASDRATSPEERFRLLDVSCVWRLNEMQSKARLAEAALLWEDGPWAQRVHAVAAFVEARARLKRVNESDVTAAMPAARTEQELQKLDERARAWLEQQADGVLRAREEPIVHPAEADRE